MTTNGLPSSIHVNGSIVVSGSYIRLAIDASEIVVPTPHHPLRLLVTGSRDYHDRQAVVAVLLGLARTNGPLHVLDGACPKGGLDLLAHEFAVEQDWRTTRMPADWKRYRRGAGPIRNQAMVDTGPDLCMGWPDRGSSGTWDCLNRALKAGIPTYYLDRQSWAVLPYQREP